MIRPVAGLAVLIVSVAMGAVIGVGMVDTTPPEAPERYVPDPKEVRTVASEAAREFLVYRDGDELPELEDHQIEMIRQRLAERQQVLDDLEKSCDALRETAALARQAAQGTMDRGEADVMMLTRRVLGDRLALGAAYLRSTDPAVIRSAVGLIRRAAEDDPEKACHLLFAALEIADDEDLRESILREIARVADTKNTAMLDAIRSTGLEDSLVAYLAVVDGRDRRRVAGALTRLKNPAATRYWREVLRTTSSRNGRVEAARSLSYLGETAAMSDLVNTSRAALLGNDEKERSDAISILRSIRSDGAKAVLKEALARRPADAKSIESALRRFGGRNRRSERKRR